ncbi:MAG: GNAT family N-acetyltransferase [Candidatus Hodarchaeota archaeon]
MGGLYPPEFECSATLSDGCFVQIRPLNFDQYDQLEDLYRRSSQESLQKRFGWTDAREWLRSVKGCIDTRNLCLVAEHQTSKNHIEVIGDCWYFFEQNSGSAEVSILVRDDFQNKTLGTQMMTQLVKIAKSEGLYRLFALVNISNTPMLRIVQRLRFNFIHGADGVNLYRLDL